MNGPRTYHCPAKVNLSLSVGAPRADGMHPICSWMVQVSLFDELTLRRLGDGAASSFDIAWADDAPQTSPIDWPAESDLIARAHRLVEERVDRSLPIAATLRKRIPVGAGLGGGSSDGAAMLYALNDLFELGLTRDDLIGLAARLGSDVAFFLGEPSAIVSGFGELLTPLPAEGEMELTLILPPLTCNTGAVYREFDSMSATAELREMVVTDEPFNDLAAAACIVEPRLAELLYKLEADLQHKLHVTGSGAAMFITEHVDLDEIAAHGVPAVHVRTISR